MRSTMSRRMESISSCACMHAPYKINYCQKMRKQIIFNYS